MNRNRGRQALRAALDVLTVVGFALALGVSTGIALAAITAVLASPAYAKADGFHLEGCVARQKARRA